MGIVKRQQRQRRRSWAGALMTVELIVSCEALNVQAKHLWPLEGLLVPPDDALDMFDDYSSMQLFVERTKRARPDFSLAAHSHKIVRICRLVDGLPLGLEIRLLTAA